LVFDRQSDIYTIAASGGTATRLTSSNINLMPGWSSDGGWIYFTSDRSGQGEIWKMHADGNDPVQITKGGAFEARESPDGKFFYYAKAIPGKRGLWTVPVDGGLEAPLPELSENVQYRLWDVFSTGIVFFHEREAVIRRLDFKSGRIEPVLTLESMPVPVNRNLAVSWDGRWIVWSQIDIDSKDISVIDHFR
jgi:hypothetical protein